MIAGREPESIVTTWHELAVHAELCTRCEDSVRQLEHTPDDPQRWRPTTCLEGQALYDAWDAAKRTLPRYPASGDKLLARVRRIRELTGLVGLSGERARLCQLALEMIPPDAFVSLLELPDEEREAMIRALEQGTSCWLLEVRVVAIDFEDRYPMRWRCSCGQEAGRDYLTRDEAKAGWKAHAGVVDPPEDPPMSSRTCRGCGARFEVPRDSAERYHSEECARADWAKAAARTRANQLRLDPPAKQT